jgi:hypothetical protein
MICVAVAAVALVVLSVACFSGSCFDCCCCLMVSAQNEQICWMLASALMMMMMVELLAQLMIQ